MTKPTPKPSTDARHIIKALDAIFPVTGDFYLVGDHAGLLHTLAGLCRGGYGGSACWWPVSDRERQGRPAIVAFIVFWPDSEGNGWSRCRHATRRMLRPGTMEVSR